MLCLASRPALGAALALALGPMACVVYDPSLLEGGAGVGNGGAGNTGNVGAGTQGGGGATGGGGAGGQGGQGGAAGCMSPAECPGEDDACRTRTCDEGVCGLSFAPAGTAAGAQTPGDCKAVECDGNGNAVVVTDPGDAPNDGLECTTDTCVGDAPTFTPKSVGTACTQGGGKHCNAASECVECTQASHCVSNVCAQDETCSPASCADGAQNGQETDLNCGGPDCPKCALGDTCLVGADCLSGACAGTCQPSCTDGALNNGESDVDCGGPNCAACVIGQDCDEGTDCETGYCSPGGACACNPGCACDLVISEVRTRGLAGGNDEFVELFNPLYVPVTLDGQWMLEARGSGAGSYSPRWTGTSEVIPARGYYLITRNTADGYTQQPAGDAALSSGISDASSLVLKHAGTVIDAVCFYYNGSTQTALLQPGFVCEGNAFGKSTSMNNVDVGVERKLGGSGGACVDTGDNASDLQESSPASPQSSLSSPVP